MDDCAGNGEFCKFYEEYFSLLDKFKDSKWAKKSWEHSSESYIWIYNSCTGQWDEQLLPQGHVRFEIMEPIISEILGDEDFFVPTSTPLNKKFFDRLESFDFDRHFFENTWNGWMDDTSTESPESNTFPTTCYTTTTTAPTEHYQGTLSRNIERFLGIMSRVTGYIWTALNTTQREKRSLSTEELTICHKLRDLPFRLSEIKSGSVFSLAKMKVALTLKEENIDLLEGITAQSVRDCLKAIYREDEVLKKKFLLVLEEKISELTLFNAVKQYPDGLTGKRYDFCYLGEGIGDPNACEGGFSKDQMIYYFIN